MKILWVLNMMLPDAAKAVSQQTTASGTWLLDYVNSIKKDTDIQLATMTYAAVDTMQVVTVDNIRHYVFPGGGRRLLVSSKQTEVDCRKVIDDFQPDIIHLHGTEYAMAKAMVDLHPKQPILLTIQGILTRISQEYRAGMSVTELMRTSTLRQHLRLKNQLVMQYLYKKNAKRERYVLQRVDRVTGRVDWDKAVMLSINPKLKYDRLNYNVPPVYYGAAKWDSETMQPHTIYTGSATYPLKGLHVLIQALSLVKAQYPDVKLYVVGNSATYKASNGYERYIRKMVQKADLQENIVFLGRQTPEQIVQQLQKANVCVLPSAMEGASASLREAMMIGTPSICAFRGGMVDLLQDKTNGFCYDFPEYPVLADRICRLFADTQLCCQFSQKAVADAELRHARERNYAQLKSIYANMLTGVE